MSANPCRKPRRSDEILERTLRPEAHNIIYDVTDEEAPPNNKPKDGGQGHLSPAALIGKRPTPAYPICRQQAQADRNEILLQIEKTERVPVTIAFQVGLDVNLEVQVDDRPKQCGAHIETNDGIGVSGWLHRAEAAEEGTRMGGRWCPCRQRLVRDRAEQRDRDQTMQYQKRRCHRSQSLGPMSAG